jgi:hypothetical protein
MEEKTDHSINFIKKKVIEIDKRVRCLEKPGLKECKLPS